MMPAMGPHFPLIGIEGGWVIVEHSAHRVITRDVARRQGLLGLRRVDANGVAYRIASYALVKESFWRRPKTPFGRGVRVRDIVWERLGAQDFASFRAEVCAAIEADEHPWSAAGLNAKDVARNVGAATTWSDLCTALALPVE